MNKNLLGILIFSLALVIYLSILPIEKVETIGDFFEKIITPVAIPISLVIGGKLGLSKYYEWKRKRE
ncbi:hypothetical protein [Maribacter flavus]|uniref:Uncharacterized protein n=1 Tax=Maribacter flavus TaxID=1658664 RepID=A0A5B2TPT4_9FLAO|nr:hypothetical protein [Maribacter flavus]KAA2216562.1 hypothetical protein F0361_11195 [Maribacter flavus]